MRKKMMTGNWKMNKTNREVGPFFQSFAAESGLAKDRSVAEKVDILFAAPTLLLDSSRMAASGMGIAIAAQNVHFEQSGAFTGETSLPMLAEIGIRATLVGHSERRQYFGETNESVAKKAAAAQSAGFLAIVCIGETLAERNSNRTEKVLTEQLEPVFAAIRGLTDIVIAYEPVWAIGTGVSATSEQAQEAHAFIRKLAKARFGASADSLRILYGGSASPKNIAELLSKADIDGGLVGGASLKPEDFAQMVSAALKA
jgi:triosephosphate isomerase